MTFLLAALALAPSQDAPAPVRVPGHAAERASATITLFDGFDAYERLVDAFASARAAGQVDHMLHARADPALGNWQRGERSAAVQEWTRLALELRGAIDDLDLLAAVLRLECVEGGEVTRTRIGFYSDGTSTGKMQVRVRALFPLSELAARNFDPAVVATCIDLLVDEEALEMEPGAQIPIAFDALGRLAPTVVEVLVGPMGSGACEVELRLAGQTLDRVLHRPTCRSGTPRSRAPAHVPWLLSPCIAAA